MSSKNGRMLNPRTMKVVVRPSFISCLICGMRIELGMMRVLDTGKGNNLVMTFFGWQVFANMLSLAKFDGSIIPRQTDGVGIAV